MSALTKQFGAAAFVGLTALALGTSTLPAQVIAHNPVESKILTASALAHATTVNPWAVRAAAMGRVEGALLGNAALTSPWYNQSNFGLGAYGGGFPAYPTTLAGGYGGGYAASPPATVGTSTMTSASPYAAGGSGFTSVPSTGAYNPSSYSPSYSPYSYEDPLAGFLRGAADVYNAQGQFQIQRAQARLMTEQWKQAQQDTRRRIHEEWLWERANTPTLQDILEQEQAQRERNALKTPAVTDIWNGTTLNTLLNIAQKKPSANAPDIQLSEDLVKRLNIVPGKSNYSLAAVRQLKDGVPLNWPLELTTANYQKEVDIINKLLPDAVQAAYNTGKVEPRTLLELRATLGKLYEKLEASSSDLGPNQYIPAKRFLNQLDDALKALQQDNVERFFNKLGNVKNVAQLVKEMSSKGLTFGPAGNGDEAAYLAVQQALSAYDSAAQTAEK